jgi:Na+-transporting methylmalonyl-CoA/oxaloacetate decarboxylase gamma subunit
MIKLGCFVTLCVLIVVGFTITMYLLEFFILGAIMWLIGNFIGKLISSTNKKESNNLEKQIANDEDTEIKSNFIDRRRTYARIASLLMEDKYGKEWMFVDLTKDDERLLDELRKEICR